jgi:hypothetical protein
MPSASIERQDRRTTGEVQGTAMDEAQIFRDAKQALKALRDEYEDNRELSL